MFSITHTLVVDIENFILRILFEKKQTLMPGQMKLHLIGRRPEMLTLTHPGTSLINAILHQHDVRNSMCAPDIARIKLYRFTRHALSVTELIKLFKIKRPDGQISRIAWHVGSPVFFHTG